MMNGIEFVRIVQKYRDRDSGYVKFGGLFQRKGRVKVEGFRWLRVTKENLSRRGIRKV